MGNSQHLVRTAKRERSRRARTGSSVPKRGGGGSLPARRRNREAFMGLFLGLFSSEKYGLIPQYTLP